MVLLNKVCESKLVRSVLGPSQITIDRPNAWSITCELFCCMITGALSKLDLTDQEGAGQSRNLHSSPTSAVSAPTYRRK